jgi:RNA polymerase sigma-70 factor (ECF subfamily)
MTEQESFFLDLVREYDARLRRICRIYADDPESRKDLYQDILMQVWRTLPSFAGKSSPGTWLYRVALNTALDSARHRTVRSRAREREEVALRGQPPQRADERVERTEAMERLYGAIGRLDEIDRALVLLHLDERSYREIADVLGISESNVGVRLHRAKARLARWLEEAA